MSLLLSELRIGNIVDSTSIGTCRITGLHKESVWVNSGFEEETKLNLSSLQPLEIERGWLKAFDFDCYSSGGIDVWDWYELWSFVQRVEINIDFETDISFEVMRRKPHPQSEDQRILNTFGIDLMEDEEDEDVEGDNVSELFSFTTKYVHNLQNAFHQTTGKDLIPLKPKLVM